MTKRPKFETTPVYLRSPKELEYLKAKLSNIPLDAENPLEVLIREQVKKRKLTLNAAMWAGPLKDIERDGWVNQRQYRAEIWHEHFKELFLPDETDPDFDPSEVLDGYKKWDVNPWKDTRVLVGSTTQLTNKGMRKYLLQMEAYASTEYGVQFIERAS